MIRKVVFRLFPGALFLDEKVKGGRLAVFLKYILLTTASLLLRWIQQPLHLSVLALILSLCQGSLAQQGW